MRWLDAFRKSGATHATATLDRLLYVFSFYAVPVCIAVLSILVLVLQPDQYTLGRQVPLAFRVLDDTNARLHDPADALRQLAGQPDVPFRDTHLAETPFWFAFTVPRSGTPQRTDIELPSRHLQQVTCWDADTLALLGSADRYRVTGAMHPIKAGFYATLGSPDAALDIVCRATFSGPARISVLAWPDGELASSAREFNRSAGLLEGGLITLSLFVLLAALINHEWMYVLFAAWLVGNLRLGGLSMGWDTQWLERTLPYEWMPLIRKTTIAVYYLLTYSLFTQLFKGDLARLNHPRLLRTAQLAGLVLLGLAFVLPYAHFLPAMWVIAALGIVIVVFLLGRILVVARSRVALWYSASLGITLFASFSEVFAAAFGIKIFIGTLNSVTAALSSSMMAALAIAEQVRAERQERMQMQAELKGTYEVTPIGLFTLDEHGAFVRVNPALEHMLDMRSTTGHAESATATRWADYFGADAWQQLIHLARERSGAEIELHAPDRAPGTTRYFLVKAALAKTRIEGSLQDITERARAVQRLRYLADNDPLTDVLNRRGIERHLEDALQTWTVGQSLAIAYLDLDRFKLINDLFGHQAGDEILKQVCRRIKTILGGEHHIGRIGGDEFLIVFRGTRLESVKQTCRRIVTSLRAVPYRMGTRAFQVRGSIGLIEVTSPMRSQEVISAADRACREAKRGRHNHMVVYERNAPAFRAHLEELRLIEKLGGEFSPQGLFLEMQPIMSLRTPHESLDFEVLLRMFDANNAVIPARKIIAAAEENGNIAVIDKWVLSTTLKWLDAHHGQLPHTRFVCVNISGASINDEKFVQDIFSMLARFRHVVNLLCFEITESVALHDLENTRRFTGRLQQLGAKIALDDFGAGYTSFSYLRDLSADALKIDGAFIRAMNAHPANVAIVEAIVELAHNLGMQSIAEWVEDEATLEALWKMGIDYVQGFAIAQPQPPERLLDAPSAAGFIVNARVAAFVRQSLAPQSLEELWRMPQFPPPPGWH